jgi:putative transposase
MVWTAATRANYTRHGLNYATDLTDEEWSILEPFFTSKKKVGRPRKWSFRIIINALRYINRTGCQWRLLPKDFPPLTTIQYWFYAVRKLPINKSLMRNYMRIFYG